MSMTEKCLKQLLAEERGQTAAFRAATPRLIAAARQVLGSAASGKPPDWREMGMAIADVEVVIGAFDDRAFKPIAREGGGEQKADP